MLLLSQITLSFMIIFVFTLLGLYVTSRISRDAESFLKKLFLFGFLLRVLLVFVTCLVLTIIFPERKGFLTGADNDESVYDYVGNTIAQAWQAGCNPRISSVPAPGYVYLNALIYFLFGHNVLIVRIFNSFLGALIPIFVYIIAKHAYGEHKVARVASILISFLPIFLYYSITHLKEIAIIFTLVFTIWGVIELRKQFRVFLAIVTILIAVYLIFLRFFYAYILFIVVITYMIITHHRSPMKAILYSVLLFCLGGLALGWLGYGFWGVDYVGQQLEFHQSYIFYEYRGHSSGVAHSTSFLSVFRGGRKIYFIPLGMLYSLLMPFPLWPFFNPSYIPVFTSWVEWVGAVVWYALMPFSVYGFFSSFKNRNDKKLLLCLLSLAMILLVAITGQGLLTAGGRHKESIMPFLMIFASVSIVDFKRRKANINLFLLTYAALLHGGFLLYLYIKVSPALSTIMFIGGCICVALVGLDILRKRMALL